MRVQWLSSAALLALIAAPGVFAQQVTTNEPFALKVSGSSQAAIQFVQPSDAQKNLVVGTDANGNLVKPSLNSMQIVNKTRINFNADAMVNNIGFGVGTTIELANRGVNNDGISNFVYVSPMNMGKITLGQTPYNADWGGFDGSMTWGTASFVSFSPDWGWGARLTGFAQAISLSADMLDGAGIDQYAPKISYTTPDLMGLSAIVAFTPSTQGAGWSGDLNKSAVPVGGTTVSINNVGPAIADPDGYSSGYNNMIEAGISYTTPDLGGVKVNVAGGFVTATADTSIAGKLTYDSTTKKLTSSSNGDTQMANLSAFQGHVQVTGYGAMAQFAYVNDGKSGTLKNDKDVKAASGMSGSVAYAMGPAQVGAYFGASTTVYEAKITAIGVGASYNVAKGAQVFAGYETFTGKPKSGASQTAGAATAGMAVSF